MMTVRVWRVLVLVAVLAGVLAVAPAGEAAVTHEDFLPVQLSAGGRHSCALSSLGAVKCWGYNAYGQLGLGDTNNRGDGPGEMGGSLPAVDLGGTATAVSAGEEHTCALLSSGAIKCWGYNWYGQLGLGDTNSRGDNPGEMGVNLPAVDLGEAAIAISVGNHHTCALLASGTVKCWGYNGSGQLGLGDRQDRGDNPGEMGANLPALNLGGTAIAISAGGGFTCALLSSGSAKCWGMNQWGTLGLGSGTPMQVGDDPAEMGTNLPVVDLGDTAIAIDAGLSHTCVVLSSGAVKCFGYNYHGELGLGDAQDRGDGPGEMGVNLPAVDLTDTATAVVTGQHHTCALLSSGAVECWGANYWYELGVSYGSGGSNRGDEPGEMGANLLAVNLGEAAAAISAGSGHTCALMTSRGVKCWGGGGRDGQLGDGPWLAPVDLGWVWSGVPEWLNSPVTIRVQTASGVPVVGGSVTWKSYDNAAGSSVAKTTNAVGEVEFTMRSGPAYVTIAGGSVSSQVGVGSGKAGVFVDGAPLTVALPDPPVVVQRRVEVVLPDAAPVPEANVTLNDALTGSVIRHGLQVSVDYRATAFTSSAVTDGVGSARFRGFATAGSASTPDVGVVFTDGDLQQAGSGSFDTQGLAQVILPGLPHVVLETPAQVTVRAGSPVDITATVVSGAGEPTPGVTVSLETTTINPGSASPAPTASVGAGTRTTCSPTLSGQSGADGRVSLRLCPAASGVWHVDGTGRVASPPIQVTVVPVLPGAFGKTAPADGAVGQPFSPTLSWGASSGATSYEYCYDPTDNDICQSGWESTGTATSVSLPNVGTNTFYWQVRANNAFGTTYADGGAWWGFTTLSTAAFRSEGGFDGWVLEQDETSGKGGTFDATSTTGRVGDDASDRQYRSIVSFRTATLPDNAVITGVTLRIKKQSITGTNPFDTHGFLTVDMKTGAFHDNSTLEKLDFQAVGSRGNVGRFVKTAALGWYRAPLRAVSYPLINLTGTTQFRLRFAVDDNDDLGADYLSFYTGDAAEADRPELIVTYYVP